MFVQPHKTNDNYFSNEIPNGLLPRFPIVDDEPIFIGEARQDRLCISCVPICSCCVQFTVHMYFGFDSTKPCQLNWLGTIFHNKLFAVIISSINCVLRWNYEVKNLQDVHLGTGYFRNIKVYPYIPKLQTMISCKFPLHVREIQDRISLYPCFNLDILDLCANGGFMASKEPLPTFGKTVFLYAERLQINFNKIRNVSMYDKEEHMYVKAQVEFVFVPNLCLLRHRTDIVSVCIMHPRQWNDVNEDIHLHIYFKYKNGIIKDRRGKLKSLVKHSMLPSSDRWKHHLLSRSKFFVVNKF